MYDEELAFALSVADLADEISTSLFRGRFEVEIKADSTPVTEADLRIEDVLRRELARRFPGDAVLGEEQGLVGTSERIWVLDPVDGTKNFAAGIPIWGTLIALMVEGTPVVGVASAPALGERYGAARGSGARMNGEPIGVSQVHRLEEALLCSSGFKDWLDGPRADVYRSLAARAARTRGFGDFWSHTLVARGAAEIMLEPSLRTWDWAALQPIVEEAGGRMTQIDGSALVDHGSAITTNGALHDEVLRAFSAAGSPSR